MLRSPKKDVIRSRGAPSRRPHFTLPGRGSGAVFTAPMPVPRAHRPGSRLRVLAPAALVILVAVAYAETLRAGFVVWDDNDHVYENPYVTGTHGYEGAWRHWRDPSFYPVTFTTFYVEWRLADGQPWLFPMDNVVLHAANAVMAGLLGGALGVRTGTAWAAAGVLAPPPHFGERVGRVAPKQEVLFLFFFP